MATTTSDSSMPINDVEQVSQESNTDTAVKEINITEDGGIVKRILHEGEGWKTPPKNSEVTGMKYISNCN